MKLEGKVAIITGSARGMGKATAKKFAAEGALVVVNALHIEGANRVAQEIQDQGGKAIAIKADVSQKAEVQAMVKKTLDSFGAIHILVNNAGISQNCSILETTEEDWDAMQNVNLKGTFLCTQAVLPQLMKQKYGKIINFASGAALGASTPGLAAYAAAKGGVISFTKSTASEAGPHSINVNCIAPGTIITEILYAGRTKEEAEKFIEDRRKDSVMGQVGKPEDIASLALFLASDDSSYITGSTVVIDGGWLAV